MKKINWKRCFYLCVAVALLIDFSEKFLWAEVLSAHSMRNASMVIMVARFGFILLLGFLAFKADQADKRSRANNETPHLQ